MKLQKSITPGQLFKTSPFVKYVSSTTKEKSVQETADTHTFVRHATENTHRYTATNLESQHQTDKPHLQPQPKTQHHNIQQSKQLRNRYLNNLPTPVKIDKFKVYLSNYFEEKNS